MATEYAHPEVLVDSEWVVAHQQDPSVRLIEVDVDTASYAKGHLQNALGFNWETQLGDAVRRDIPTQEQWESLLSEAGVAADTTVVLYGDNNNWFAAYAFWLFQIYGHADVRLLNGGRKKWEMEGRPLITDVPQFATTKYQVTTVNDHLRAYRDQILAGLRDHQYTLVDVRSPAEYSGEVIAPAGMTETAQRGGHIPGAKSIPWIQAANEDGTFKPADQLHALYGGKGVDGSRETIAYCRIGERSSHTWFALKYLLGYENVRNYDGSWTEWGSIIGAPIEREAPETKTAGDTTGAPASKVCPA
ncbi:MAG: sulfurtransferase [Cytophagales bacterium]|nr:sulfurtransferase [Armatimonadota bacterium]